MSLFSPVMASMTPTEIITAYLDAHQAANRWHPPVIEYDGKLYWITRYGSTHAEGWKEREVIAATERLKKRVAA